MNKENRKFVLVPTLDRDPAVKSHTLCPLLDSAWLCKQDRRRFCTPFPPLPPSIIKRILSDQNVSDINNGDSKEMYLREHI